MKKIFKYIIDPTTRVVQVPKGAKLLSVQSQNDDLCAWFEVNPNAPLVDHSFTVFGTGHDIPEHTDQFIGTIQLYGGTLVLHVYYGGEA